MLEDTRKTLSGAGIATLMQGETLQLPRMVLAAYTDVDNKRQPRRRILKPANFAALPALKKETGLPLAAMVHGGTELSPAPDFRGREVAKWLEQSGVDVLIGAHPHVPGKLVGTPGMVWAWSLGNFLFDQRRKEAASVLLEVVFFPQGTYWVRQHNLGDVYNRLQVP